MRIRAAVAALVLAVSAAACDETPPAPPEPVAFATLAQGAQSDVKEARREVIRDGPALAKLALEVEVSALDFGKEQVIAVFLGERPTAGYKVAVEKVVRLGDGTLEVTVREKKPAKDAIVAQVVTAPFILVKTARTDGKVVFKDAQ